MKDLHPSPNLSIDIIASNSSKRVTYEACGGLIIELRRSEEHECGIAPSSRHLEKERDCFNKIL